MSDRTFSGPQWAWDTVWETLELDSQSPAFDIKLRALIVAASAAIQEDMT